MKWIPALMLSLAVISSVHAAGPDDQYLEIYNLIQQTDLLSDGQAAAVQYGQAQTALKKLQAVYPEWNPEIVKFRLQYVADKLATAPKLVPAPTVKPAAPEIANVAPAVAPAKTVAAPAAPEVQQPSAELVEQVRALTDEKMLLERKLKEALSVRPPEVDPRELAKAEQTIIALKKERDLLSVALEQKQSGVKESQASVSELSKTIKQLRARLAVVEASPIPYTAEELALLKKAEAKPAPLPAAPAAASVPTAPIVMQAAPAAPRAIRSVKDLPPGAGAMMAEAQRSFVAGDFAAAEQKYSEVLRQDEKNVYVLSHLANAQRAAGHLDECEKTVQQALAIDPDDAASLFMLGNLRLSQNKLDEALDALSHSASINPTNATTQNSLGSVLGQKGMRKPAEAALRKALLLDPAYPDAHYNLALVYAIQQPPFMELARWHYKKAIDLGYPKAPELEKLLAEKP